MMHNTKFLSLFSKRNIAKLPTNGTASDRLVRKMACWINFGFSLIFSGPKEVHTNRHADIALLDTHTWCKSISNDTDDLDKIISRIAKIQFVDSDISRQQTMLINASSSIFLDHRSSDRPIHLTILQQRGFNPPSRNIENPKHPSFFQS